MVATSELTLTVDAEDDLLQTYEYATMEELQHFVNKLNVNFTNAMRVEYLGPMAVATNTILCLYPAAGLVDNCQSSPGKHQYHGCNCLYTRSETRMLVSTSSTANEW